MKGTLPYRCRNVKTKGNKLPTMQDHQPIESLALGHRVGINYHPCPKYDYQYQYTGFIYSCTPPDEVDEHDKNSFAYLSIV